MRFGIPQLGRGLLQPHTSYTPDGKGGNTLFLPIPFARSCKITFEDEAGVNPTPKYYHINYRKYPEGVAVETFDSRVVARAGEKIAEADNALLHPQLPSGLSAKQKRQTLQPGDSLCFDLPDGENAVYEVRFRLHDADSAAYARLMRRLVFKASFDGVPTVWVPLSDYSGGGMGAPAVESWFLSADGRGGVVSRWLMPYRNGGKLLLHNLAALAMEVSMEVKTAPLPWDERSLYFHASWKQERGLPVHERPDEDANCREWNFATLTGRGVYKGDVLTLYNHSRAWYGEGDEKIWVDNDAFPSHFGTGTEDYYNSSWAPVVIFHTPFGGAPRADQASSHGYNTFFRTRNLDAIPFDSRLRFDLELLCWKSGEVDYATTVYWYGDAEARAHGTSGAEEAVRELLPIPVDWAKYRLENAIEFEGRKPVAVSSGLRLENQGMLDFPDGKWSGAAQLLFKGGKQGGFAEFEFDCSESRPYKMILYATKAVDYAILAFSVNGKKAPVIFDGYDTKVTLGAPLVLGSFLPVDGKLRLKVTLTGTNPKSEGDRFLAGLDCLLLE